MGNLSQSSSLKDYSTSTAEGIAAARYLISLDPVTGVRDREARWYFGWYFWLLSRRGLGRLARFIYRQRLPGIFAWNIVRVHHFDQRIVRALRDEGVRQVCILGAGFDNRALRLADELSAADAILYEVDLEDIQQRKQAVLNKHMPEDALHHVRYVTCDFMHQQVDERLLAAGWRTDVPSIFVWEGVVYYLSVEAVDLTLHALGRIAAPGSRLAFDYIYAGVLRSERDKYPELVTTMEYAQRTSGETFIFDALEPGAAALRQFIGARGMHVLGHWDRDALTACYAKWLAPSVPDWGKLPNGFAMAEVTWG